MKAQLTTRLLIQLHFPDNLPITQVDAIARSAMEILEANGNFAYEGEPPFFQPIGKTVVNYQVSYRFPDDYACLIISQRPQDD